MTNTETEIGEGAQGKNPRKCYSGERKKKTSNGFWRGKGVGERKRGTGVRSGQCRPNSAWEGMLDESMRGDSGVNKKKGRHRLLITDEETRGSYRRKD